MKGFCYLGVLWFEVEEILSGEVWMVIFDKVVSFFVFLMKVVLEGLMFLDGYLVLFVLIEKYVLFVYCFWFWKGDEVC